MKELPVRDMNIYIYKGGPDGAVAMSSANGLVGTGYTSPIQSPFIKAQWIGVRPLHPSLTNL